MLTLTIRLTTIDLITIQLEENVFNKGYAEVLIAEQHKDSSIVPVGMALVRSTSMYSPNIIVSAQPC